MTNSRDLILKLKEVKEERKLSIAAIMKMLEDKETYVSKSTLNRIFAEGSEDITFRYEATIKPLANVLLDIDTIEADDTMDVQAMKSLLAYKSRMIEELERKNKELQIALDKQKIKASDKLEEERAKFNRSIEFLKEQVAYKDKRMDLLLSAVQEKDELHKQMLEKLLKCAACKMKNNEN